MPPDDSTDESSERPAPRPLRDWIPDGGDDGFGSLRDAEAILDRFLAWVANTGLEPYEAQEEALLEIMADNHVVLSTPTGSGKSLVALGVHFKALCEGRRSFYTAPIKALVSEKFFALCDELGPENVGMLTGDASINWSAPVICCTAEILANMAVRQGAAADAPYVVMDEFHYYADRDRGAAWQIPLIALPKTRFLLMSATLGDTSAIEKHIQKRTGRDVAHVHNDDRPVPLDYRYAETPLHETIEELLKTGRAPIYVVNFTQRAAAENAQALTSANVSTKEERQAVTEAIGDFRFDSAYGKDFSRILRHGVGLHHAGLLPKYRRLVEKLAQQGLLKVICGTDTLGVGVNVPIRTVLFTQLAKYDGTKQALLRVRDFKQIAGRAGRRGFDTEGSVVCQAPEHVIENQRATDKANAAGGAKKRKLVKKKPPKYFVNWTGDTFDQLVSRPTETLEPRFRVPHGLVIDCLQRGAEDGSPCFGYEHLLELIDASHGSDADKRRLRREAAARFRSLREAEVVRLERGCPAQLRIDATLQENFSLHHSLSLYLVEAAAALDPTAEEFAFDVLSLVEAILEDPRALLYQQERREKDELVAQMKAEGIQYEERMERLEKVTWPQPNAEFIHKSFEVFADRHPWVRDESIRPKGIAREMALVYSGFDDYVKRTGLARMEGLLLRYLSQVWNALSHNVPASVMTDELRDITEYLRATVTQVDSSLVAEWEASGDNALVAPKTTGAPPPPREPPILLDPRAFRARVRAECHRLVRALSVKNYEEAVSCVRPGTGVGEELWTPERFEEELAPYFAEYESIVFEPRARENDKTWIKEQAPKLWDVHQTLVDERDEGFWNLECTVDLQEGVPGEGPILALRRIGT